MLISMLSGAAAASCGNDLYTLSSGHWLYCDLNPSAPTVYKNFRVQVENLKKEGACGGDHMDWQGRLVCDGTTIMTPDSGHCYIAHDNDNIDLTFNGAWNCASQFEMSFKNSDSTCGQGDCAMTMVKLTMSVDVITNGVNQTDNNVQITTFEGFLANGKITNGVNHTDLNTVQIDTVVGFPVDGNQIANVVV